MTNLCILPFIHTLILPDGDINLCCNGKIDENMPSVSDNLNNILNNPRHMAVRKEMLEGGKPKACSQCWENESMKVKSYRQKNNLTYMKYFPKIFHTDKLTGEIDAGVKYFDVRFNNTCNYKCVMCSSSFSSLWIDDEKKLIPIINDDSLKYTITQRAETYDKESFKWSQDVEIVQSIINSAPSLDRIHFAGGEPLLSKHHKFLIQELIRLKLAPNLFLSYNTNGELIDHELLNLWSQFKHVKVFYSLDSIGDKNDYIRFPSVWKGHESRLDYIESETPKNVSWRLLSAISLLNVAYIPEMADWKLTKNYKNIHNTFFDGNLFHTSPVIYPQFLNSNVLPIEIKDQVKEKIIKFSSNRNYKKIVQESINIMYSYDKSELLTQTKEYLNGLDSIRKTDFKKTFPILKDLF
jgi:MoaA/NifB/PqqE/SkfB family radical SAM enzyme